MIKHTYTGIPGADKVYAAAKKWVDCALRSDGSLIRPAFLQIWTGQGSRHPRRELISCGSDPDAGEGSFYATAVPPAVGPQTA